MCYQHHGSNAFNRTIVRGLWRMLALSGLLWMLFSVPARAQAPDGSSRVAGVTVTP